MKKEILIIFICLASLAFAYTVPDHNAINLVFTPGYTSPHHNAVNLVFGEILSTCIYSGSGNWDINCGENCTITVNTDVGGNNITISGHGLIVVDSNVTNWNEKYVIGNSPSAICDVNERIGSFK